MFYAFLCNVLSQCISLPSALLLQFLALLSLLAGWFLSMKKEDAFLNRIKSLEDIPNMMDHKNRFKDVNDKTLGIMVVRLDSVL